MYYKHPHFIFVLISKLYHINCSHGGLLMSNRFLILRYFLMIISGVFLIFQIG